MSRTGGLLIEGLKKLHGIEHQLKELQLNENITIINNLDDLKHELINLFNDGNPDITDTTNPFSPTTVADAITIVNGGNGTVDILANDDFLPGANTTITNAATGSATGIVTFNALTGEMTYTPAAGEEGTTVTVDYTVCNTAVNPSVCKTTAVTITVQPDNDNDGDPDVTDLDDDNDGNPDSSDPNPLVPTVSSSTASTSC